MALSEFNDDGPLIKYKDYKINKEYNIKNDGNNVISIHDIDCIGISEKTYDYYFYIKFIDSVYDINNNKICQAYYKFRFVPFTDNFILPAHLLNKKLDMPHNSIIKYITIDNDIILKNIKVGRF